MSQDSGEMQYETFDLVRMRRLRRVLRSLLVFLENASVFTALVGGPITVCYLLARLFDNVALWYAYFPSAVVLGALLMGFWENCRDAINELDDVEKHIERVNRVNYEWRNSPAYREKTRRQRAVDVRLSCPY